MLAQFLERKTCSVLALAAVRAVEVRIINVREGCGLELGVFHVPTVAPAGCGLLLYNSYSIGTWRALYKHRCKVDAAERLCPVEHPLTGWAMDTALGAPHGMRSAR